MKINHLQKQNVDIINERVRFLFIKGHIIKDTNIVAIFWDPAKHFINITPLMKTVVFHI